MSIHAAVVWRPKLCSHLDWISGTGQPGVNGFLEHPFMALVCFLFVWVLDVCWLWGFCGVLLVCFFGFFFLVFFLFVCLGFFCLFGRFFSFFLRAWGFGFLCLILGRLFSQESQESISVVWCKMTPLWIKPYSPRNYQEVTMSLSEPSP